MPTAAVVTTAAAPTRNPFVEWIVPIAAVSLVFVMLVPLPAFALDLLLATSIAASVLVLLSAVQILRPVQFSVFPSLLLLLTLFRLSLNLASSRRILLHGNEGAGGRRKRHRSLRAVRRRRQLRGRIRALPRPHRHPVHRGQPRRGAHRRGHGPLYPRRHAGQADGDRRRPERRHHRRSAGARPPRTVTREAEFYGAMDGAARFNQRDSMATILITAINISPDC